jgi:hypothetical protein
MTIPITASLEIILCRKVPAGWSAPLVGAGYFGGHRAPSLIEHRAVGLMLVTGLIPAGRIPPQTNLGRRAQTLLVGSMKTLVKRLLVG